MVRKSKRRTKTTRRKRRMKGRKRMKGKRLSETRGQTDRLYPY